MYLNWLHCSATKKICGQHSLFHAFIEDIKWNFFHVPEVSYGGSSRAQKKAHKPSWRVRSGMCHSHFSAPLSAACFLISIMHCCHGAIKIWGNSVFREAGSSWAHWRSNPTSTTWTAALRTNYPNMWWVMCWAGFECIQVDSTAQATIFMCGPT